MSTSFQFAEKLFVAISLRTYLAPSSEEAEKINVPEDSVKNASLPYIIAIKKEKEKQQND